MRRDYYNVLGIMSGTSLDGLDLALCEFKHVDGSWKYKIIKAQTKEYTQEWKEKLKNYAKLNSRDFILLHKEFGRFIGSAVNIFLKHTPCLPDFISSHGHTSFHEPEIGLNFQLGDGACIAATTGITTVSDFRTLDIALGGQGAPLVPIGDLHLFNDYEFCLNLGGFANISYQFGQKRIAYDISPCNIKVNQLMETINRPFDRNGELGATGKVNDELLKKLNSLQFYGIIPPKSLSLEWLNEEFSPIVDKFNCRLEDKIATIYEHIAIQINRATRAKTPKKLLLTGGGTHNKYLVERIKALNANEIIEPESVLIDFKEAIIFAFLGLMRYKRQPNCLASVTGARFDNVSGIIHYINKD